MPYKNPEDAKRHRREYYLKHKKRILAYREATKEKQQEYGRKASRKIQGCVNPTGETKMGDCPICGVYGKLCYDHDHKTGLHRGWPCKTCNLQLGQYEALKHKIAEMEKYLGQKRAN